MRTSDRCVFVSHCILAQTVRAEGCAKSPAVITQVIEFLMRNHINIIQMPCPETLTPNGGLGREAHGKKWYEENGLRGTCTDIAISQVGYMKTLIAGGKEVIGVIGITFSPACSTEKDVNVYRQQGIYIEELEKALSSEGIDIPMISVNPDWCAKLEKDLERLVKEPDEK